MHVSARHCDGTVPSDPRESPNVAAGFSQASQERVTQTVKHEWPNFAVLQRLLVLLLDTRRLDVSARCRSREDPALVRLLSFLPTLLENCANTGRHRQYASSCLRLTMRYEDRSEATINPSDIFPALAEAFFRSHSTVYEDRCNVGKQGRSGSKILCLFGWRENVFSMALSRLQFEDRRTFYFTPFHG